MMNRLIIILVLLSISTINIFAEEPQKIQIVIVSGVGVNADKAKQNAIRNAVEQVVGSYLSSETIVKNNQVLKDEILSYSGGYVKDLKIISQEMNPDGLFNVKIEAGIVSTKIIKKLESLNIATKKVEGESLFGEAVSRIDEQKGAGELLGNILSKYPQAAYNIEVGKPEIKATDQNKNTAKVGIPLVIRWDNAFIEELKDVLLKVSKEEFKMVEITFMDRADFTNKFNNSKILCFSRKAILKSAKAEICGIITEDIYEDAISKGNLDKKNNLMLAAVPSSKNVSISIYFKDKENDIIDSTVYELDRTGRDSFKRQGIEVSNSFTGRQLEFYSDRYHLKPNTLWGTDSHLLMVTDGAYTMTVDMDISVTTLSKAASIEVQVEPWKRR